MLLEGDSPIIAKLNGIHEAGSSTLRAGSIEPFRDYPVELKNRYGVYLCYTEPSEQLVRSRILDEVREVGQNLGIGLFVAGQHSPDGHPIHTTLLEGLYQGDDENARDLCFGTHPGILHYGGLHDSVIGYHPQYTKVATRIHELRDGYYNPQLTKSWEITFNAVLVDKGPVLLAATEIPQEILDMRSELTEIYDRAHVKPLPLDNLLHMTLTRMTMPVDQSKSDEYIERIEDIHRRVIENPLQLLVKGIFRGHAFDMLQGRETLYR